MDLFDCIPSPKRRNAERRTAIAFIVLAAVFVPMGIILSIKSAHEGGAILVADCLIAANGLLFAITGSIRLRRLRRHGETAGHTAGDPHAHLTTSAELASCIVDTLVDHGFIPKGQFDDAIASVRWELDCQHGLQRILLKDDREEKNVPVEP